MLEQLRTLLEENNKTLVGVLLRGNLWYVYIHDSKKAGPKPIMEYCRDEVDYRYLEAAWNNAGTSVIYVDKDFDKAMQGAIEAVKAID